MQENKNLQKYWLPVAIWTLIILAITTLPGKTVAPVSEGIPFGSTLVHFSEFLVFSILLYRALANEKMSARKALILTIIISLAYSSLTEILQLYVPGRFFDYNDMLANDIGAIAGLGRSIYALTV